MLQVIGGRTPGAGKIIAFNGGSGILLGARSTDADGNTSAFFSFFPPSARCFEKGDLVAGFLGDSHLQWRGPRGEPIRIIGNAGVSSITDLAFAANATLWAANQTGKRIERFSQCGHPLGSISTGSGGGPSALIVDAAGNLYVGFAEATNNVRKYDSDGNFLAQYTVPTPPSGISSMDLASDQRTLFYVSRPNQSVVQPFFFRESAQWFLIAV